MPCADSDILRCPAPPQRGAQAVRQWEIVDGMGPPSAAIFDAFGRHYQAAAKLKSDAIVGAATWKALQPVAAGAPAPAQDGKP